MTPKEKVEELILKFLRLQEPNYNWFDIHLAKKCALIAVNEIIAQIEPSVSMDVISARIEYWQEVKQEIEKL